MSSRKDFLLNLHFNGVNSYIFVNVVEVYKFKAKDFEISAAPVGNMKKTGLYKYVYDFTVDYDTIDVADILDIHKYVMAKNNIT